MNREMKDDDVVVTGIGTVSPYGKGTELFWTHLGQGDDAISEITKINVENNYAKRGGEITWYNPNYYFSKREQKIMDTNAQYGILALEEAKNDAKIDEFPIDTGIFLGTLTAGFPFTEKYYKGKLNGKVYSKYITQYPRSSLANQLAIRFDIYGPRMTITTACSAGVHALAEGAAQVQRGKVSMAVVGGVDAFCELTWSGFSALRALSETELASFSKRRNGTQIGEGGGMLILEKYKSAKKRNANIYGVISGWGASADAYHITAPNPEGDTEAIAIKRAIMKSGVDKKEIDVVVTHGTGTELNDKMETKAIKLGLEEQAYEVSVTSIKSMIGHTMGAAGIHSSIALLGMIRDGKVYPTIHYKEKDENCDLAIVANQMISKNIRAGIVNAFGFGGNNAAVLIQKP